MTDHEKKAYHAASVLPQDVAVGHVADYREEEYEVFRKDGEVNFRTVEWQYVISFVFICVCCRRHSSTMLVTDID